MSIEKKIPKAPRRLRNRAQELLAFSMFVLATSCVPHGGSVRPVTAGAAAVAVALPPSAELLVPPPAPESLAAPALPVEKAVAINAAIPFSRAPNPAAASYVFRASTITDQMRALDCLTDAIYYEARSETEAGQRAVAQVVLNRVRHPAYPNTVCGVVYQGSTRSTGCQFTFTCDGSRARAPREPQWSFARRLAAEALAGSVFKPVGHATHYHTFAVAPRWASSLEKSAVIGAHIFYRWAGGHGTPRAFRDAYAGREPGRGPIVAPAAVASAFAPLKIAALPQQEWGGAPELAAAPLKELDRLPQVELTANRLPQSRIRDEYKNSGAPREKPLADTLE